MVDIRKINLKILKVLSTSESISESESDSDSDSENYGG